MRVAKKKTEHYGDEEQSFTRQLRYVATLVITLCLIFKKGVVLGRMLCCYFTLYHLIRIEDSHRVSTFPQVSRLIIASWILQQGQTRCILVALFLYVMNKLHAH